MMSRKFLGESDRREQCSRARDFFIKVMKIDIWSSYCPKKMKLCMVAVQIVFTISQSKHVDYIWG